MEPYRQNLYKDAAEKGWPVVRPMFFHYPEDSNTHNLNTQYMFGENITVAPVLASKIYAERTKPVVGKIKYLYATIKVYLPAGSWTRLWYEDTPVVSKGETIEVDVRFGKPAVYYKSGDIYGAELSAFVNGELMKNFPSVDMKSVYLNTCNTPN